MSPLSCELLDCKINFSSIWRCSKLLLENKNHLWPTTHWDLKKWSIFLGDNNSLTGCTESETVELFHHGAAGLFSICKEVVCCFSVFSQLMKYIHIKWCGGIWVKNSLKVVLTSGVYGMWLWKYCLYLLCHSSTILFLWITHKPIKSRSHFSQPRSEKIWSDISILVTLQLFHFLKDNMSKPWIWLKRTRICFDLRHAGSSMTNSLLFPLFCKHFLTSQTTLVAIMYAIAQ